MATALGPSFDPATKGKLVLPELYDLFQPDKVKDQDPLLATPVAEMWATQLKKVASSFNSSSHGPAQQHVLSLITNLDNKAYLLSGTKDGRRGSSPTSARDSPTQSFKLSSAQGYKPPLQTALPPRAAEAAVA